MELSSEAKYARAQAGAANEITRVRADSAVKIKKREESGHAIEKWQGGQTERPASGLRHASFPLEGIPVQARVFM